jgi:hypothetical protein
MKFENFSRKSLDMGDDPEGVKKSEDDLITPDDGWDSLDDIITPWDKTPESAESLIEQRDEELGEAAMDSLSKLLDEDDWEALLAEIQS